MEFVYNQRDNKADILLKADGQPVDLIAGGVSRMKCKDKSGTFEIDSVTSPDAFNWTAVGGVTGKVILDFGGEAVAAGEYSCWFVVYDPTNPQGVVWGDAGLSLKFRDS